MDLSRICYIRGGNSDAGRQVYTVLDSDSPDWQSETTDWSSLNLMTLTDVPLGKIQKILTVTCSAAGTTKKLKIRVDLYGLEDPKGNNLNISSEEFKDERAAMAWIRHQVIRAEMKLIDQDQVNRYLLMK